MPKYHKGDVITWNGNSSWHVVVSSNSYDYETREFATVVEDFGNFILGDLVVNTMTTIRPVRDIDDNEPQRYGGATHQADMDHLSNKFSDYVADGFFNADYVESFIDTANAGLKIKLIQPRSSRDESFYVYLNVHGQNSRIQDAINSIRDQIGDLSGEVDDCEVEVSV